jgi:hypothetical protein
MIWQTWRQHRSEAALAALILTALGAAMLVVGNIARDRARSLGLPACTGAQRDCTDALDRLHRAFHSIPPFTGSLIAVPLLAGMFWAAPLVSREYEAGTHRLAWTQSVSPLRWITIKIILIFSVLAAAALALGLLATWTLNPLTAAFGGRYNSTWYDIQGVVPVACMLFALGVGVAASALIRRTIPAMAFTLFAYAAARIPIHFFRAHLAPIATRTNTIALDTLLDNLQSNPGGAPQPILTTSLRPSDLLMSASITDPSGHRLPNNAINLDELQRYCPNLPNRGDIPGQVLRTCRATIQGLDLRETLRYQPASHFWLIQTVESAMFLAVTAVLVAATILAVTRRRPT